MDTQSSVAAAAETAEARDEGNTAPAGDASAAAGFFVPQPDAYALGVADWAESAGALELFVWVDVPERKLPRVIHQVFGLPADPELIDRLFRGPVVIAEKTAQEELFEGLWREVAGRTE